MDNPERDRVMSRSGMCDLGELLVTKALADTAKGRRTTTERLAGARAVTVDTVPSMTLDDDTARDLSRAAANVRTWTTKRNDLIREALAAGAGVREVARATGLAPASVLNIQTPKKRGGTRADPTGEVG